MNIEQRFSSYLKEGEHVLWTGHPRHGFQFRDADLILLPVSIILLGFSASMIIMLQGTEGTLLFRLFAGFLFFWGIYLGFIRFLLDRRRRKHIIYAITNKRVLMMTVYRRHTLKTMPLKNIEQLERTVEKDGSGFVIFGSTNPIYPWLLGTFYFSQEAIPGLVQIEDVMHVYDLLITLIKTEISPQIIEQIGNYPKDKLN